MPVVNIQQLTQSVEAKRKVAEAVTDALVVHYGVDPEKVQVFFHESDRESWAKGGKLGVDRG
ncbi:tautomerase family protein [Amycolatopsis anabasis]|uniref:tautomerase family protein n=1 Tax=Amycolatopsis anabasis TaxID=1840409 RepID=UPI00131B3F69|nr:4-oxalocrotonate tautomerase family protein [Amycolatopsis anabasis]